MKTYYRRKTPETDIVHTRADCQKAKAFLAKGNFTSTETKPRDATVCDRCQDSDKRDKKAAKVAVTA